MRGARFWHCSALSGLRIIPADAGSTTSKQPNPYSLLGSSPRMRGALFNGKPGDGPRRIIPADAGSTGFEGQNIRESRDHPRGCGEHPCSPHSSLSFAGIIPADAGSTGFEGRNIRESRDHPLGCGEHPVTFDVMADPYQSSPRMRGAPHPGGDAGGARRIIPADARSTLP